MQGHQNWLEAPYEAAAREAEAYEQWVASVVPCRATLLGKVREADRQIAANLLPDVRPTDTLAQEDITEILRHLEAAISKLANAHVAEIGAHLEMWPSFDRWCADSEREPDDERI